jgi:hypothetical protein
VPVRSFARTMHAESQKSHSTREGRMVFLAISFATCWSMNTLRRTCFQRRLLKAAPCSRAPILVHSDRSGAQQDGGRDVRVTVSYRPLREALEHRWSGMTRRQTKSLNPAAVFVILGGDNGARFLGPVMLTSAFDSLVGISKCSPRSSPG